MPIKPLSKVLPYPTAKEVLKKARETPVGNDAVVPETVALLAHHLDGDPDPYFSGVS